MLIGTLESSLWSTPQTKTAMEAAVDQINSSGGIDGRNVEASFCNDKYDPNEATACAQRAVEAKVVAVVGGATSMSTSILSVLEAAKIPLIGGAGSSGLPELQSPISYPVTAGAAVMNFSAGKVAAEGSDKVALITADNESSLAAADFAEQSAKVNGATSVSRVTMKMGTPDVSSIVSAALDHDPGAVFLGTTPDDVAKIITSLRQAGFEGRIVTSAALMPPSSIEALGKLAEGVMVGGRLLPTTSVDVPEVQEFLDAMKKEDPDATTDDLSMNTWTAMRLFATVLEGRDVTDGASVIDALAAVDKPIHLGTAPDYVGIQDPPEVDKFPRVSRFAGVVSEVVDGKLVQQGDFFNPLDG